MNNDNDRKRIQNLFSALQNDSKSVFYLSSTITKKLLKKLDKSPYQKDRVFKGINQKLEDKELAEADDKIPLKTPFVEKKDTLIDQLCAALKNHFKESMLILLT